MGGAGGTAIIEVHGGAVIGPALTQCVISHFKCANIRLVQPVGDIALILRKIDQGTPGAVEQLMALVYAELRKLASAKMGRDYAVTTRQPTALVHEAWLRLGGDQQTEWQNRRHFFGAAAEAMRQILIERVRRRTAIRHGGGLERVDATAIDFVAAVADDERVVAVSEALERLAMLDPEKTELVKLCYFVGLTIEEEAAAMAISASTAKRWWAFARAWLAAELRG